MGEDKELAEFREVDPGFSQRLSTWKVEDLNTQQFKTALLRDNLDVSTKQSVVTSQAWQHPTSSTDQMVHVQVTKPEIFKGPLPKPAAAPGTAVGSQPAGVAGATDTVPAVTSDNESHLSNTSIFNLLGMLFSSSRKDRPKGGATERYLSWCSALCINSWELLAVERKPGPDGIPPQGEGFKCHFSYLADETNCYLLQANTPHIL